MNQLHKSTIKAGILVLIFSILGKLFSFFREVCFSAVYGTSNITDAYFAANTIPSLLNIPITISSLMFFIPIYNELRVKESIQTANYFSSNVLNIFTLITAGLTVSILLFAEPMVKVITPGFDEDTIATTVKILKLLSLAIPFTLITSVLINISNANQKHFAPQLLVIVNSSVTILAILLLSSRYGIYIVPISGFVAWVIQMFLQRYFVGGLFKYRFVINFKDPFLRKIILLAIPVIIASFAEQANLMIGNILASKLSEGSISIVNYALRIQNLINGTLTIAIITVMYPIFSILVAKNDFSNFSSSFSHSIRICLLTLIPLSALCIIAGEDIIRIIYYRGNMPLESIRSISRVFVLYSMGIVFIALREVYIRIFYTLNNSKIPMYISVGCSALNVILNVILINKMDVCGLALATSVANVIYFLLMKKYLKRKFFHVRTLISKKFYIQVCISTLMLMGIWYLLSSIINNNLFINFVISALISLITYVVALFVLNNVEVLFLFNEMKASISTKFKRPKP